jgi:predicted dehydrogenase
MPTTPRCCATPRSTPFVCTPTVHHAAIVADVAAAGRHLFCEKPLAMSLAEARAMHDAVRRGGVRAQIGLVLRFSAIYWLCATCCASPTSHTDGGGLPRRPVFSDPRPARHRLARRSAQTAGGTLIEHGVHDLDLLTWLFGPIATLRAWQQNHAGHHGVEDYVAIELAFASGLRAQLVTSGTTCCSARRTAAWRSSAAVASSPAKPTCAATSPSNAATTRCRSSAGPPCRALQRPARPRRARFADWYGVPYFLQDLSFIEASRRARSGSRSRRRRRSATARGGRVRGGGAGTRSTRGLPVSAVSQ